MDNFSSDDSIINISNGVITDIQPESTATFVTVTYTDCINCQQTEQTVRLRVGDDTELLDENGNDVPVTAFQTGMTINAAFSAAMTRSIPPQAAAFFIQIVRMPQDSLITMGRILNIDRRRRTFTTVSGSNTSSIIQFNVPSDVLVLDRSGTQIPFSQLVAGLQVRVRHASFMTLSLPPQTTAYEIRVL